MFGQEGEVYAFSPYAIPTALTAVLMLVSGIRVLARRVSRVSLAFFSLTFFCSIWLVAFTFMYCAMRPDAAQFWSRIAYLGVPFIPAAVYHFTLEMLRVVDKRRVPLTLSWTAALAFSAIAVSGDALLNGVGLFWWGYYPRYAPLTSLPFLAYFFGYLIGALVEFILAWPAARGAERTRIRMLIIAFGVAYIGCVDFFPKYGIAVYPFGYIPLLLFVAVVAQTVRRYDLVAITPSLAAPEIINTMADVLFVCDRDGRIRFANQTAEALLGFDADEFRGMLIEELLMVKGETISSTLDRRSIRSAEFVFKTKKAEAIDLTLSIAPVMYQGEAAGAVIIGRDMRERKRAEREVRRAVTLLQSTLDSTADGILVVGEEGKILTCNQRFTEMWRIPQHVIDSGQDDVALQYVLDQLDDPNEFIRAVKTLYEQPEAESFDLLEFKDGRRFERYSIGRRIDGVTVRVWSFRDVTARFATEAAMRESELRYRLLFEQNAAGVCVTDLHGVIVDCNSTFAQLVGFKRPEIAGKNIGDLYERRTERDELIQLLLDAQTLNGVEVEMRRSDGARVWVLQNLALVGRGETAMVHATVVDISDRKRAEEQIEFHAYHDVLTHLPNRRLFTDRLALSITRARRSGRSVAVMFIDLDHFKTINDTLGHTAGDELLLEMSHRLTDCVREDDTVARLGGDEFTMILSELRQPEDAVGVAQKILDAVEQPMTVAGMTIELSASIGIALYPVDGVDVETLLRNADSAMYRAKESGRNNYQLCTDEMKTRALQRLSLETRLRKAIQSEQLVLLYQPMISLITGRVIGAEALVRWLDPERGLIEPGEFIPIAEESRLIIPLGDWVLRAACKQARQWRDSGLGDLRISINLSARQFQQQDLADTVRRAIAEAGIDPKVIELEITETTAMQNAEMTIDVLRALSDIGVSIAIDDFGTGYSSLSYLKRFPLNAVKIDRSFVAGVDSSDGDAAIVAAVVAIARSLHLRVVAEGVENEEQLAFLRRRGCDEAQGFHFSKPVTAETMTRALGEKRVMREEPRLSM
jgi:diguanylate cyclase (GGDEF)-like protein/PAS domain S-box-containing protein